MIPETLKNETRIYWSSLLEKLGKAPQSVFGKKENTNATF